MTTTKKKKKPPREIDKIIGENIARFRKEKKWSQQKLAEAVKCSPTYINKVEHYKGVGKAVMSRLAKALEKPEWAFYVPFPYDERIVKIVEALPHISPDLVEHFYGIVKVLIKDTPSE